VNTWRFDQDPNVAAITTRQVLEDRLPILRVVHYSDDHSWAFTCGTSNATEDGRVISMAEALEIDPTLETIAELSPGWHASRRAIGKPWVKELNSQEDRAD
jgi:hypothetical protein